MHTHTILLYMGRMHAGMENQYCIPMDQYQDIATLYILNQKCMRTSRVAYRTFFLGGGGGGAHLMDDLHMFRSYL